MTSARNGNTGRLDMYDVMNEIRATRHWTWEKGNSAALSESYWISSIGVCVKDIVRCEFLWLRLAFTTSLSR